MSTYLDHAASSPLRPEAEQALLRALRDGGNASSLHGVGRRARRLVEDAREQVGVLAGVRPMEVVFTAGGTEADNLAVKGLFWSRIAEDPRRRRILLARSEHHAVLDPVEALAQGLPGPAFSGSLGAQIEWLELDEFARVRPEAVAAAVARDPDSVALISMMWANNEVGTVQPIDEVAHLAAAQGIPLHVDAVQAGGHLDLAPTGSLAPGISALSLSAHKMGGPIGVGALIVRRGVRVTPVLHGGGQEGGIRSGTLATPLISAFGAAAEIAGTQLSVEAPRVAALRDRLIEQVRAIAEAGDQEAVLRGHPDPRFRLPGNAHFTFAGCDGDSLLYLLDARGIACSTGSACRAGVPEPSHVLSAMGLDEAASRGALRFSMGWSSTAADVDAVAEALPGVLQRARRAGVLA